MLKIAAGKKPVVISVHFLISGCGQASVIGHGKWINNYYIFKWFKRDNVVSFNARAVPCHAREYCFLGQTKILKWCHLNGNLEEALLFYLILELALIPHYIYISVYITFLVGVLEK